MNKNKLSTQPYKGTTDMYPDNLSKREYLFNIWKKVARKFGYEEYDTPLIEDAQMYRVKSGDEIANKQLFNFIDKGDREVALRPEMTPSLARIVAAKKNELTFPLRWFNVGRFFRYEKPQKGRTREFYQLNIDLLGVGPVQPEIEIIMFVMEVMKELKAPENTYELKINSRELFDYFAKDILDIDSQKKDLLAKAVDNYLKMSKKDFEEYLEEIGLDREEVEKTIQYINWDITNLEKLKDKSKGAKEILQVLKIVQELGIKQVKFAPYIMRGLAYYTGVVVEMYDIGSKENPRALFGGGRYDSLLEIFGKEKIEAFGLGWGDVTTLDYLQTYNLLPEYKVNTEVFITLMDESLINETLLLSQYLRSKNINTEVQLTPIKLAKQLKYADKKQIPWVVVIGEEEMKKGVVQLKDMVRKETFEIKKEDIIYKVK